MASFGRLLPVGLAGVANTRNVAAHAGREDDPAPGIRFSARTLALRRAIERPISSCAIIGSQPDLASYDNIAEHRCPASNKLVDQPWTSCFSACAKWAQGS